MINTVVHGKVQLNVVQVGFLGDRWGYELGLEIWKRLEKETEI